MKKIKICFGILSIIMIWIVGGCSKQKIVYEDTYILGQDFQYMYYDEARFGVYTVEAEGGYYKLLNSMIYYIEKNTMSVVPLCSKPNCLHDKDTKKKRMECNAYIDSTEGFLGYYGNHLYALCEEFDENERRYYYVIYRITMDGVTKDKVYTIKEEDELSISQWMVHRGYLYYAANQKGEDKKRHTTIWRVNLEKPSELEEVCAMTKIYNSNVQYLGAYGNYVYFYNDGFNKDITSDLTDNWVNTWENVWYCYNIVTGEVKELFQEQKENGTMVKMVQYITFWQNKLLIDYFPLSELDGKKADNKEEHLLWQCDLNGENYEKLMVVGDVHDKVCASENYIYVYNFWRKTLDSGEEKPKITVYDKEMKLVDEMEIEVNYTTDLSPGDNKYSFFDQVDHEEDVVRIGYIDKSDLGNYMGKKIDIHLLYEAKFADESNTNTEDD
ncbi:MAG: hypothetical protein K2N51_12710 [Lachnospiraceae bacterium]|nr:hypothetical protein [Lachnospiraceae bacterium]